MGTDHRCVMARFEIPKDKEEKGKPRKNKAPATEQHSEKCDDGKHQKYLDLEQRVKEADSRQVTKESTSEAKETNAEAAKQEEKAVEAEGRTATEASEASAAEEKILAKSQAAAPEVTGASEEQEKAKKQRESECGDNAPREKKKKRMKGRQRQTRRQRQQQQLLIKAAREDTRQHRKGLQHRKRQKWTRKIKEFGPSYTNGKQLESTTKIESVKSAKRSKNASGETKGWKDSKKFKKPWKKSKVRRTSTVSNQRREEFLSQRPRTRKAKQLKRDKELPTFSRNSTKTYT